MQWQLRRCAAQTSREKRTFCPRATSAVSQLPSPANVLRIRLSFPAKPCSFWAAITRDKKRYWDLAISIQPWAYPVRNLCFGFSLGFPKIFPNLHFNLRFFLSNLATTPLPSFSQERIHIMVWNFPCTIPLLPSFTF